MVMSLLTLDFFCSEKEQGLRLFRQWST